MEKLRHLGDVQRGRIVESRTRFLQFQFGEKTVGGRERTVVGIKKFVTRVGSRSSSFLKRNRLLHGMGGGR